LGSVFPYLFILEFTKPNYRHTSAFFFQFPICRVTVTSPSTLKPFLLFVPVATLLR